MTQLSAQDVAYLEALKARLDEAIVDKNLDDREIRDITARLRVMRDRLEAPDWDAALQIWVAEGKKT